MIDRGILLMLTGTKHANVLVVAVHSLRKSGYCGPIHIAVGDDASQEIAAHIFADSRLGPVSYKRWQPPSGFRNSGYLSKTHMDRLSPFDRTVFLDADTMTVGDLGPLFDHPSPVVLTQFSSWKSNGRKISGRIRPWSDVAPFDVQEMTSKPYAAVNTGVIAFDRSEASRAFFAEWRELTAKKPTFICDELSAQLIYWRHKVVVLDSRFNCSPIHDRRDDAVVYHFHGRKHVNREQGRKIWLPAYDDAVKLNIAGIQAWTPAGDRRLQEFLEERGHRLTTTPQSA